MPRYDIRCDLCKTEREVSLTFAEQKAGESVERPCDQNYFGNQCGGTQKVVVTPTPVIWNTAGGTRGYGFSRVDKVPRLDPNRNLGHNPPTVGELGLDANDCKQLGL